MRKLTDQCDICAIDEHSELDTAGSFRLITVHSLKGVSTNLMSSKFTLSRIISSDTMTLSSARRFVSTLTLWLMWQLHIKRRRSTGQIPISTRCRRACDDFLIHWVIIRINISPCWVLLHFTVSVCGHFPIPVDEFYLCAIYSLFKWLSFCWSD